MRGAGHRIWLAALSGGLASVLASPALAASMGSDLSLPRTTFGEIGLIEMPSARMAPDGQISLSGSAFKNTQRYSLGFQALPWLSLSFRYSALQHLAASFSTYYDRSYGVKIRLFDEGEYRPAIAVGVNDLFGTGVYGGEYVVASKRVFDDFDVTAGIGWGRLAGTNALPNPLGALSRSFKPRRPVSSTGQVDFGQLFHGPKIGVFGGVVWRTPIKNLSLIAEYSSDGYTHERVSGNFQPHTQFNFGANYRLLDNVQLGVDWLYGESLAATLSINLDPTKDIFPRHIAPKLPAPDIRTAQQKMAALEAWQRGSDQQSSSPSDLSASAAITRFADQMTDGRQAISSLALHGRTMLISTGKADDLAADCRRYALLAASYVRDIDRVVLSGPRQRQLSCTSGRPHAGVAWQGDTLIGNRAGIIPATMVLTSTAPVPSPPRMVPPDQYAVEQKIRRDVAAQSLGVMALSLSRSEITLYFENKRYRSEAEAVGRLTRVLMNDAPPDIEVFHLISINAGIPIQGYRILRGPMERAYEQHASSAELASAIAIRHPSMDDTALNDNRTPTFPRFSWAILPDMRVGAFAPGQPLRFAFSAGASAKVEISPGLALSAGVEGNIWNDFSSGRPSNSKLPHVRSDTPQYYKHGANGITSLMASYHFRLTPDVYGVVKAGYLESMFGGAGGEILWRPEGSRFALGADLYEVWQRNFDRLFGFQRYHVLTGHVSLYYNSPWYNLDFHVMAGQYLAGDRGVTFEVSRRFSTGVEIGAFATFTDTPFKTFGPGSFDKGIMIHIPLAWALPASTQSSYNLDVRHLTRDGGQRLLGDTTLYNSTRRSSLQDFVDHSDSIMAP